MIAHLNRLLNRLRRSRKKWNPETDRTFHDQAFAAPWHEPFNFSFFGYITIKRFADLAAPYIRNASSVMDLGCGPAEITCELARRFPKVRFHGVDHSPRGIARAKKNAASLRLKNIDFQVADIANMAITKNIDLVTMFDSFHHLGNPRTFIQRMKKSSCRFLLIEPRGNWQGKQVREYDFDWIVADLEKIRGRISAAIREPAIDNLQSKRIQSAGEAAAVENRYNLEEFRALFKGYGLRIRGTVSGLDHYPPRPFMKSRSREFFNAKAYEIYAELDDWLFKHKRDLLAKHWLVYADKTLAAAPIKIPAIPVTELEPEAIKGPYDVKFLNYSGPKKTASGSEFRAQIQFQNLGFRTLSSLTPGHPDLISYHWLDRKGATIIQDGRRTLLPAPVAPNAPGGAEMRIVAPAKPGHYILAIDLVQEGQAWFSDAGNPCYRVKMRIT